jgi:hypothetical protein
MLKDIRLNQGGSAQPLCGHSQSIQSDRADVVKMCSTGSAETAQVLSGIELPGFIRRCEAESGTRQLSARLHVRRRVMDVLKVGVASQHGKTFFIRLHSYRL